MTTNTGKPAFPVESLAEQGMTLRDYFAAKAMEKTMVAFEDDWSIHPYEKFTYLQWASERAYAMADAMLEARKT